MGALTVNNSDLDFLYATLNRIDWNTKTFGSTIPHIYFKDYGEKVYGEPSIEEQKKIGLYFKNLDTLITLHQSKSFEYIFKAIVNCTLYWEQRKHGEVFIYLRNNALSREELNDEDGFAQSIHYGDVLIKYGECLNVSNELLPYIDNKNIVNKFKKFYIQNGDVIIADTAEDETVGKCIEISGIVDHNIISGLHTIPLRPVNKFAYGYLGFYLNSNIYHNQLKPLMQGIKVTSISKNLLKTTTLNYPSNIQEQKIIGRYFDALNHLITLHQLEPYKLIFKAIAYRIIDYAKSKPPRCIK
ncbi:type I restriction modification DNA specificity domain protein [Lachnoanaerobaculum sp. ICM7]|nr:type I restriction modification DNA specificity domain protein [Lachnoanaerobaculum sp. ICM7]